MEKQVTLSRSAFGALLLLLFVSLLGIAFLLGRESRTPELRTEAPVLVPVLEQRVPELHAQEPLRVQDPVRVSPPPRAMRRPEPRMERRVSKLPVERLEKPVPALAAPVASPIKVKPKSVQVPALASRQAASKAPEQSQDSTAIRIYFQQIDSSLKGTQSLGDPTAFATELLESSLSGDNSKLESLAATAKGSLAKVQAVRPPASCAEHHKLLLKQLRQGAELLSQVGQATGTLDASSLSTISASGATMQAEAERLQELERELRSQI